MRIILIVLCLLHLAVSGNAAQMPVAKVEYSADSKIEANGMIMNGKVYHGRDKDRMEMNVGGSSTVMIVRTDKQIAWMLMPEQKTFMEMSLEESQKKSSDMTQCVVEQKAAGTETINGVKANKSAVSLSCPDNKGYRGGMWVTKDGIMVKMDVTSTDGGENVRVVNELSNLKLGQQPAKLFEVPPGYQPMNIGGLFGGIGAAMKSAQDDAVRQQKASEEQEKAADLEREKERERQKADALRSDSASKSTGEDVVDTINKVKGFLSW